MNIFERESRLRGLVAEILHHDFDFDKMQFFKSKTNEVYEEYQYENIELPEKIAFDDDYIDEVLFFGDGTIEFHLQKEQDAFCWDEFPIEVIEQVIACMNSLLDWD